MNYFFHRPFLQRERTMACLALQRYRVSMKIRVEASRIAFERLGSLGSRPGRKSRANVAGIIASGYSFRNVRKKVVHIQKSFRAYQKRKNQSMVAA